MICETLPPAGPCLFPLSVSQTLSAASTVREWKMRLDRTNSLTEFHSDCWNEFLASKDTSQVLVFLASSQADLLREIGLFERTWETCLAQGRDWKTPAGSCFTPGPLGSETSVAFVYPGIGSLYPRYCQELLALIPDALHGLPAVSAVEMMATIHPEDLWEWPMTAPEHEWPLYRDIVAQAESTVSLAYVCTSLLQQRFNLRPSMALGYSLGELAMFASCGCWSCPQELSTRFRQSPAFRDQLGGRLTVFDGSVAGSSGHRQSWRNYVVPLPRPLESLSRPEASSVYVTHINSAREIVVAGPMEQVEIWLRENCLSASVLPSRLVYHCQVVAPVAEELMSLFDLPLSPRTGVEFVSMAPFGRIPHQSRAIARTLVNTALRTVDFPEIVDATYLRGARIFVEIGPRNACSSWIHSILGEKPHLAASIDQKGMPMTASLSRLLAQLLSHKVPMSTIEVSRWSQSVLAGEPFTRPSQTAR